MSVSDGNIASFEERRTEKRGRFSVLARRVLAGAEFLEQKKQGFCIYFSENTKLFPDLAIAAEKQEFFGKVVAPGQGLLYNCSIKNMGKAQKMED